MAKIKSFAVEVEITRRVFVYVDARKAGGAIERLQTPEGWAEAVRYRDEDEHIPVYWDPKTMAVIGTREADI